MLETIVVYWDFLFTMKEHFVTYEQALALKELGMNERIFGVYGKSGGILYQVVGDEFDTVYHIHFIKAPLKQQVFKFFREKYRIQSYLTTFLEMCSNNDDTYHVVVGGAWYPQLDSKDYEEAENACIDKLIELVKQQ